MRDRVSLRILLWALSSLVVYFVSVREAHAVPSFARKYKTSCLTCHTIYPVLNPFGEAFRRNGYRFPSTGGSTDTDVIKDEILELGQDEYKKTFPNSVWPDEIMQAVPLSVMVNGSIAYNFPNSDANDAAGNSFTWQGILREFHIFGSGDFSDKLTHFTQLTINDQGIDIETAYLLWNDVIGKRHYVNIWVGRLMSASLTSFGIHGSYLNDNPMPAASIAGLYNPTGFFSLGPNAHTDGVEVNGVIGHRIAYAMGWVASGAVPGLHTPNAEDVYAHIGYKLGGLSLDGEGISQIRIDPMHPWAETSITLDGFAYHGLSVLDNGTGVNVVGTPSAQGDRVNAVGAVAHAFLGSLVVTAGAQYERHTQPYQGSAGTAAAPPNPATYGVPDFTDAHSVTQYTEVDYVIYPWLVPGIRAEYTLLDLNSPNLPPGSGGHASLTRIIPGIAVLPRANLKLVLTGDVERAYGLPPAGSWGAAGGQVLAPPATLSKFEAEQINLFMAWSF